MAVSLKKSRKVDLSKPPLDSEVVREYTPEHLTEEYSPAPELKEYTPQHHAAEIIPDHSELKPAVDSAVCKEDVLVVVMGIIAVIAIIIAFMSVVSFVFNIPIPETETDFSLGMMEALDDVISFISSPGVILPICVGAAFFSSLRMITRIGGGRP